MKNHNAIIGAGFRCTLTEGVRGHIRRSRWPNFMPPTTLYGRHFLPGRPGMKKFFSFFSLSLFFCPGAAGLRRIRQAKAHKKGS